MHKYYVYVRFGALNIIETLSVPVSLISNI